MTNRTLRFIVAVLTLLCALQGGAIIALATTAQRTLLLMVRGAR